MRGCELRGPRSDAVAQEKKRAFHGEKEDRGGEVNGDVDADEGGG